MKFGPWNDLIHLIEFSLLDRASKYHNLRVLGLSHASLKN